MQDTVNQVHGAVPRALAGIIAVLSVCRPGRPHAARFPASGGACRAGGNERIVGRVQQVPAGLLGVCGSLRGKAIAPLSVVPTPLHVPHGRFLPRCGALMLALARTTRARASAAECVAARPDDESTGKMPGDSRTAIRLRLRARSPAFRSARPLSHGECACCACRSGRSARMRARGAPRSGPAAGIGTGSSTGYPAP